jgi:hypothetical protein
VIALLLDLANIIGGFLLAIGLLQRTPRIGDDLVRADTTITPFAWVVGVVALVGGGYYLIVHLTSGPHVFHFEVIGIAVGVVLLWDRLTGRPAPEHGAGAVLTGRSLLLAILGVIAIQACSHRTDHLPLRAGVQTSALVSLRSAPRGRRAGWCSGAAGASVSLPLLHAAPCLGGLLRHRARVRGRPTAPHAES